MKNKDIQPRQPAELRSRAEKIAEEKGVPPSESLEALWPEEARNLSHELRVHQVELEIQNEELNRAQFELDATRARYFDLYDLAPVGYVTVGKKGLILEANLTAAILLGKAKGELIRQPISQLIHKEDQDLYYFHGKQLRETGVQQEFGLRMVKKDGTSFWAHLVATAAQDAHGVHESRIVISDITERKRTWEAFRQREERHRTILRTAMDGFWMLDVQGRLLEVNETYCQMSGYSLDELLTMCISDLEAVETADDIAARIQRIMTRGEDRFESRHRRKNGSIIDVEVSIQYHSTQGEQLFAFLRDITERKRAEAALRESEEKYRLIADNSSDWIYLINHDGQFQYVSPSSERMTGYPAEAFINDAALFLNIVHPDDKEQVKSHIGIALKETEAHDLKFRIITREGELRWISHSCLPIYNDHGQFVGRSGTNRDITDRRRGEERDKLVRDVLASLNNSELTTDTISDILQIIQKNTGIEAMGVRLKEGEDFPYYQTIGFCDQFVERERYLCARDGAGRIVRDPQGHPMLACMCGNILSGQTSTEFSFFTEGGSFWTNCTTDLLASTIADSGPAHARNHCNREGYESVALVPLRADNEIIGLLQFNDRRRGRFTLEMVGFFEGLGASIGIALSRKRTQEALLEGVARSKAIFNATSDSVMLLKPDGVILDLNETAADRQGMETGTLLGKNIFDFLSPEGTSLLRNAIAQILNERRINQSDERRLFQYEELRDGKCFSIRLYPVVDEKGKVFQLAIFSRDITGRKQMEQRLQQVQRMQSIGDLAGGIAHDFNNILYPIIGISEMLMEELPAGSPDRENVEVIFNAAMRAGDLVKQILSFSRQADHVKVPVRVQYVLKEVLKLTRSIIPADIEITKHIQKDCGLVMADPTQLHQIAMNLITNAYHAVEKAGGRISVELKETLLTGKDLALLSLTPGKYALISISDTGYGIDPAVMGKIFEPYFTTKEVGKGTGLGLSVVHGIVKDHDGDIWVQSEPGKGSTFTVYLPIMKSDLEPQPADALVIYETGSERILVVDDEAPVARMEQMMLEKLGYHVTIRASSFDALAAFKANPHAFDLVITDMTMPVMTGEKLARELNSVKPGIPVIICTGFSSKIDAQSTKVMGIKGFLMKPVVKSDMAKMVRNVLDEVYGQRPR